MPAFRPTRDPDQPPRPDSIQAHALDHLRFIRETMERAGPFTAVSGIGQVVVGVLGLVAAVVAGWQRTPGAAVAVWLVTALIGAAIAVYTMWRKAARAGLPLLSGPGRKFALGFLPPLMAGGILTAAFCEAGQFGWLPGTWLLLFGAAVVSGGFASVGVVPIMGGCFMVLGAVALAGPAAWGTALMGAGFGVVHIVFGAIIKARYGG